MFPIDNRLLPNSLWKELHPRSRMNWEWDEGADKRVAELWHLREELSRSGVVIYTKWYQGRATFFSRPVFSALYNLSRSWMPRNWPTECSEILEVLRSDSPLSTRQIKEAVHLKGKMLEPVYEKAMKILWQHLDVVGFGEIEDSSFPSLAVGATETLFEDLLKDSRRLSSAQAHQTLDKFLPNDSHWRKYWNKISMK